eukprot:462097_1
MNENCLDIGKYGYTFDENDILIRMFFNESTSRNVIKFLQSRYTQTFITLTILLFLILRLLTDFIFTADHLLYRAYLIYVLSASCLIWIPFELLWIFSVNRTSLKLLIRSFTFWLKIIAALFYALTHFIYTCISHSNHLVLISYAIFNLLTIPLVVVWISIFDGLNVNRRWKIAFSGILATIFLLFSINYEFLVSEKADYFLHIPLVDRSTSYFSVMASSLRILSIFSFKQCFFAYYYTNKCVTIRYSPRLIWYKAENIDDHSILYSINLDEQQNEQIEESQFSQSLLSGRIYGYKFNENDILLTKCVGGNIAKNIINFLHNPLHQFLTALTMLVFVVLRALADFIFPENHLIYFVYAVYLTSICYLVWFPLTTTWITISNRLAFKLLMQSFEFWLKVVAAYFYAVINLIYNYQIHNNALNKMDLICYSVFNLVIIPLAIVCVSILDAVHVSKMWKMTFSGICGAIFLFFSFHYEFSISKEKDYIVLIPYINRYISFCSMMASTGRILGIFTIRQFFLTYYFSDKCVLIRYTPYLMWNTKANKNVNKSMEMHQVSVDDIAETNVTSWEEVSEQIKMDLAGN